ncbi:uncharacterized protein LOC141713812 [Apium graveolens]|uniref:uncharacterized protein LOC141713812 n=1 Tax=Apium graveolens TaxID=4045 RepID=UPI003D7A2E4D
MLPRSYVNAVAGNRNQNDGSSSSNQSTPPDEQLDSDVDKRLPDHPGLVLIAKKLVGQENYAPRSRSMQIALSARNKFVVVNGVYVKPANDSALYAQWERVNDMIITWILNSVADDISDSLNFVTSAKEVWDELHERFSGVNGHMIYQVMRNIHSLEQGNKSVEVYFHKLKGLWDEFVVLEPSVNCSCGAHKVQSERDQNRKLLQFFMGLHDSNATVRGQILMMSPLPSLSQAYAYTKQDEKARQGFQTIDTISLANAAIAKDEGVAAFVKKFPPNRNNTNSTSALGQNKVALKCSFCNFNGHTIEHCYKLIGYPPNWKKKERFSNTGSGQNSFNQSGNGGQFRNLPSTVNQVSTAASQSQVSQIQQ